MKTKLMLLMLTLCAHISMASDLPDFPFIYAEGKASTNIAPDTASISFTVHYFDKLSSNATARVEKSCIDLITLLQKKHGVDPLKITAKNLRKSDVQKRGDRHERLEILGYDVSREISFKTHDIDAFPLIMKTISDTDLVSNIDARFSLKAEEEVTKKLMRIACQEARSEANLLATASSRNLGDLFSISTRGFRDVTAKFCPYISNRNSSMPDISGLSSFGDDSGNQPLPSFFAPDTIEFRASVATIYKLK